MSGDDSQTRRWPGPWRWSTASTSMSNVRRARDPPFARLLVMRTRPVLDYLMPGVSETGEITMEHSLPLLAVATSAAALRDGWRGVRQRAPDAKMHSRSFSARVAAQPFFPEGGPLLLILERAPHASRQSGLAAQPDRSPNFSKRPA